MRSRGSAAARQWVLIAASLVFYGWWDPRFVILVVSQITATWLLARAYEQTGARAWLIAGVVLNLASLGTFKYLDFLLVSFEAATGVALPRAHLILPIGISFFSFQLISYLVDRMRGNAPLYPFRPFALFVLVFPHVIAGPIVRHNELVPQFALDPRREGMWAGIGAGLVIFTVGFAKKVLLADRLAPTVDQLFAQATQRVLDFGEAWTAGLAFSFQLFLDFSAYTEMAIGSALLFGLVLPENFRRPYLSTDLRDFWRRWHISLSNFLRDYLYIPLGGSRHGASRYVFATIVTMGLCGLVARGRVDLCRLGPVARDRADRVPRLAAAWPADAGASRAGPSRCCSCSSAGWCSARTALPPPDRSLARSQASTASAACSPKRS